MRDTVRVPFVCSSLLVLALAGAVSGCSALSDFMSGDKVDYKSGAGQTKGLEVPPDLTQLAREGRYQPPSAVVSAAAGTAAPRSGPAAANAAVAATSIGDMKVVRDGDQRWLSVPQTPEQVWPQLKAFWIESGFQLAVEDAQIGVIETEWAQNRAKLPQDLLRNTLGRVFESLYDTGERDRFRMRVERTAGGSEVFISHRRMTEQFTDDRKDQTRWLPGPNDPQVEAEFLTRMMVRLGSSEATARTALAAPAAAAVPRARMIDGQPTTTLEVDEGFDRAWRRVGLVLDRSGFTVEDRNRSDGVYFVRYVDGQAQAADKGFFARLFSSGSDEAGKAVRYRIALRAGSPDKTMIAVQSGDGSPVAPSTGQRIASVLVTELK
jgi:outer membrane protein assembly factor BamC